MSWVDALDFRKANGSFSTGMFRCAVYGEFTSMTLPLRNWICSTIANLTTTGEFWMRRLWVCALGVIAVCLFFSTPAFASKVNTADFPLRVHIIDRNGIRHYHGLGGGLSTLEAVDGMGQGNLFENGQALGFDFTYKCGEPLTHQSNFETFMARWKNRGRAIEMVMPVIGGKPGEMNSCELRVTMKQDTVYSFRNGALVEQPAATYKQWMIAHQYDPEHERNEPVDLTPAKAAGDPAPSR
jgi:hypothetical protein